MRSWTRLAYFSFDVASSFALSFDIRVWTLYFGNLTDRLVAIFSKSEHCERHDGQRQAFSEASFASFDFAQCVVTSEKHQQE